MDAIRIATSEHFCFRTMVVVVKEGCHPSLRCKFDRITEMYRGKGEETDLSDRQSQNKLNNIQSYAFNTYTGMYIK